MVGKKAKKRYVVSLRFGEEELCALYRRFGFGLNIRLSSTGSSREPPLFIQAILSEE